MQAANSCMPLRGTAGTEQAVPASPATLVGSSRELAQQVS
jgi:hypothetical protein